MKRPNYFALAIGLCASVAAAFSIYSTIDFRLSSIVTTGEVIRLNSGGHHPQIAFDAKDGRHYERLTGTIRSFTAGQSVLIRYRPDDPDGSAMIDSVLDLWTPSVFLLILAVGFLDAGLRGEALRKGLR
ncbi:hypothetical protein GCT13_19730 [Paraburkholderia sp. CNPSo 3157]|uniref:DUF3592 domain-containing protein n=1 Tax=Paraburkholderia franconis TaxID=2654983 RepID=A0A7X1TH21_9BURK|nr:DUF3592 domain-containing protein [Paraburkholderia franconis]MPW19065.1 hypothetical protein [Paraburkholderia franconis]